MNQYTINTEVVLVIFKRQLDIELSRTGLYFWLLQLTASYLIQVWSTTEGFLKWHQSRLNSEATWDPSLVISEVCCAGFVALGGVKTLVQDSGKKSCPVFHLPHHFWAGSRFGSCHQSFVLLGWRFGAGSCLLWAELSWQELCPLRHSSSISYMCFRVFLVSLENTWEPQGLVGKEIKAGPCCRGGREGWVLEWSEGTSYYCRGWRVVSPPKGANSRWVLPSALCIFSLLGKFSSAGYCIFLYP